MTDFAVRIIDASLETELGVSFGRYARATILDRAIPDVRDGLKPVQRRIIYAMNLSRNIHTERYRKCAKTVGEVMGNFHPHGDASIYDALVRMAQPWKMRAMLVDGHGNFGSIDDDPPAAMRYTEARLSPISAELVRDLDKDTVAFQPNFDDNDEEPTVLPAAYPNLLVNGTSGVSTGFATEIPPHNLGECIDACVAIIDDPAITLDGLMVHVRGPDFPTGGLIVGASEHREAYESGRGRVVLRARTAIETKRDGRQSIVVTEIPYGVVKAVLVKELERLRLEKVVNGVTDVRDETDREGLRIVIDLGKSVAPEPVLAYLFKKTELQVYRHFLMVAIVDRTPEILGLRAILDAYLRHRRDVVTRRSRFELEKARARLHLVEGLIRAVDVLDEVIAIIRASKDRADAHANLMARFSFSDLQTREILDLRLHRLTGLQILELRAEMKALLATIGELERLLGSERVLMSVIRAELLAVQAAHADPRRTQLTEETLKVEPKAVEVTVTVKEQPAMVGVTREGYIKRSAVASFEKAEAAGVKAGDLLRWVIETNTLHKTLLFTAKGHCFTVPVHQLPESKWSEMGTALVNVVGLEKDDRVVAVLDVAKFEEGPEVLFVTRQGSVKRTALSEFDSARSTGVLAIKLGEGDEVAHVVRVGAGELLLATREGMAIRFSLEEVPVQGRNAGGVRGMRVLEGDRVVAALELAPGDEIGTVTEEGRAKRTALEEYPLQRRSGRGVRGISLRQRLPHRIAAVLAWPAADAPRERLCVVATDETITLKTVAEMKTAARDGNGYPYIEPAAGEKVAEAWRAEPLPPPEGGEVVAPPEPPPPPPLVVVPRPETDEEAAERGGWARAPNKPAFLPGFEPEEGEE